MLKILLDTDIGGDIDDAICLAYLLKEPQCDLLGITTVCGEPEKRAAAADAICRAAGRQVPIVAGLDTTLQPVPLYPTPEGAGALEQWPHSTYEKGDAPEFLYEKIRENPHSGCRSPCTTGTPGRTPWPRKSSSPLPRLPTGPCPWR